MRPTRRMRRWRRSGDRTTRSVSGRAYARLPFEPLLKWLPDGGGDAPEKVRAHLDSGVLEKLFAKKHEEMLDPKMRNKSLAPRDYAFCFLGACAMSVGCRIPPQYKLEIQKRFLHVGFLETAECQMSQALNGPDSYVEGVPYQADIPTEVLDVHLANTEKQMGGSMMLNVPAPFGLFPRPPLKNKALRVKMDEGKFGGVACGGCGAEKKEGGEALLRCAKCKKRGYCSAECQKAHWKLHKKVCSPPEAEGGGKENSAPQVTIKTGRGS